MVGGQGEPGLGLAEIVEASGFNKPAARRLLPAPMRAGLVRQSQDDRCYYPGGEATILGTLASPGFCVLRLAMPSLARPSSRTAASTHLSIRRSTFPVCLHREDGTFPIRAHALQVEYEHPLGPAPPCRARARGYAVQARLILANSWGVGPTIRHPNGPVAGAIGIAAINSRMQPPHRSELGPLLLAEAAGIERAFADQFHRPGGIRRPAASPLTRRKPLP